MDGNNFGQNLNNNTTPPNPLTAGGTLPTQPSVAGTTAGATMEPAMQAGVAANPAGATPVRPVSAARPTTAARPIGMTRPVRPGQMTRPVGTRPGQTMAGQPVNQGMNPAMSNPATGAPAMAGATAANMVTEPTDSVKSMEEALEEVMREPAMTEQEQAMTQIEAAKPKKDKKLMIILAAVFGVLLVVIIVVAVLMMTSGGSNSGSNGGGEPIVNVPEEPLENTPLEPGTIVAMIDGQEITYSAAYLVDGIDATIGEGVFESAVDGQSVFVVANGGSLMVRGEGVSINKVGGGCELIEGEAVNVCGLNSAIIVVGEGSTASIEGATISTTAYDASAVVATNGGVIELQDTTITTTLDNSKGLVANYGGTINANDVAVTTTGANSAAVMVDRGAGVITADGMTLTTAGFNSPLIYSNDTVTISDSTGTATGAQIAVIEGENTITMDDCDFTTNGIGTQGGADNAAVMIYRPTETYETSAAATFTATGTTLTVDSTSEIFTQTPIFFVTNVTANLTLTDFTANFYEEGYFVLASGTGIWGTIGANGATVTVSATDLAVTNQNVGMDAISSVTGLGEVVTPDAEEAE